MALLWHELFMIKMMVFSHINSNGEGDILPWIQIQPGMQLVVLD